MKKIVWNKVTWYSWWGAVIFFLLVLPGLTFYIGRYYEGTLTLIAQADAAASTSVYEAPPKKMKTHRNYAGKYEIRYPAEWSVSGYAPTVDGMDVQIESSNQLYNLGIFTTRTNAETINEYLERRDKQTGVTPTVVRYIQVNGVDAVQREENNGPTRYYSTYILSGNTMYILRMEGDEKPFNSRQVTVYQELIASFRII